MRRKNSSDQSPFFLPLAFLLWAFFYFLDKIYNFMLLFKQPFELMIRAMNKRRDENGKNSRVYFSNHRFVFGHSDALLLFLRRNDNANERIWNFSEFRRFALAGILYFSLCCGRLRCYSFSFASF